jgi:hypothetical protein
MKPRAITRTMRGAIRTTCISSTTTRPRLSTCSASFRSCTDDRAAATVWRLRCRLAGLFCCAAARAACELAFAKADAGWSPSRSSTMRASYCASAQVPKVVKSEQEWRAQLTALQFQVTRQQGTERAFSGEYDHLFAPGLYRCICCGNALFSSATKYDSKHRLAEFLGADRQNECQNLGRQQPGHDAQRSRLR